MADRDFRRGQEKKTASGWDGMNCAAAGRASCGDERSVLICTYRGYVPARLEGEATRGPPVGDGAAREDGAPNVTGSRTHAHARRVRRWLH